MIKFKKASCNFGATVLYDNSKKSKVVITGITGQDGSYMAEYLLENTDYEIVGTARRTSQFIGGNLENIINHERFRVEALDITDSVAVSSFIQKEQPDYFINFAAQTFVKDSWDHPISHFDTNAKGPLYIMEAVRQYSPHTKIYLAGSSEQWGDVDYSPQDLGHPFKPRSPYGASKCASHLLSKVYRESYGIYVVQGILFNHESPRRQEYFVTRKITKAAAKIAKDFRNNVDFKPLELGNTDAKRDWSHAKDFVDGIWLMMNQKEPKDYILSSNETHSVKEFVEKTFQFMDIYGHWEGKGIHESFIENHSGKILVKVNPKFYRPAEVDLLWGNSLEARKELNWSPKYSFSDLVQEMTQIEVDNLNKND